MLWFSVYKLWFYMVFYVDKRQEMVDNFHRMVETLIRFSLSEEEAERLKKLAPQHLRGNRHARLRMVWLIEKEERRRKRAKEKPAGVVPRETDGGNGQQN